MLRKFAGDKRLFQLMIRNSSSTALAIALIGIVVVSHALIGAELASVTLRNSFALVMDWRIVLWVVDSVANDAHHRPHAPLSSTSRLAKAHAHEASQVVISGGMPLLAKDTWIFQPAGALSIQTIR